MTGLLLRAAGLLAIYLLVLTSLLPGDVLVGGLLAIAVAFGLRSGRGRRAGAPMGERLRAGAATLAQTAADVVRGTWRVVRFCLGADASPGLVDVPRGGRSRAGVAVWAVLTSETPDEFVVDVDEERDVLIVHVIDARDPAAVRARHRRDHERWQRKVTE